MSGIGPERRDRELAFPPLPPALVLPALHILNRKTSKA